MFNNIPHVRVCARMRARGTGSLAFRESLMDRVTLWLTGSCTLRASRSVGREIFWILGLSWTFLVTLTCLRKGYLSACVRVTRDARAAREAGHRRRGGFRQGAADRSLPAAGADAGRGAVFALPEKKLQFVARNAPRCPHPCAIIRVVQSHTRHRPKAENGIHRQ